MMLPTGAAVTTRRRALGPRFGAGGGVGMSEASPRFPTAQWRGRERGFPPPAPLRPGFFLSRQGGSGPPPPKRPAPRGGSSPVPPPARPAGLFNQKPPRPP